MSEFQDKKAVICFFIAESVVLFASKESDSNRSELTKQVTAAQLAIAFRQSLQARPTTSERRAEERRSAQLMSAVNGAQRNNLTLSAIYTKAHLYGGFSCK